MSRFKELLAELKTALNAIEEGYPWEVIYYDEVDAKAYVTVENPSFKPDNGEDPNICFLVDLKDNP